VKITTVGGSDSANEAVVRTKRSKDQKIAGFDSSYRGCVYPRDRGLLDHVGAAEGCGLFGNPTQKQPYAQTKNSGLVPFYARPESCHDA
jgi:hypothetical protein